MKEKPPSVDHIMTACWFVFEVFADEAGEGIETQLECGGVDRSVGGFGGGDVCGVGAGTGEGEGEREKKKPERDGEGEGDNSGESERLCDGEKGSESGDNVEGKGEGDGDGERVSLSSSTPFAAWRSFLMDDVSPCSPMCLSQAGNFKHNLMHLVPNSS